MESPYTFHYIQHRRERGKKKKSCTKSNLPDLTGRCHFFYPHSFLLIPSHVIKQGLTNQFTFSQDNKKSQFQKDGDIFHKLYTHTKSPTLLLLSLFSLVFPPFSPLHLGDIFKQAISSTQCVGYGIWIFIAHRRRCRRFNLDYGVISTHTDSDRDLETAGLLRASNSRGHT